MKSTLRNMLLSLGGLSLLSAVLLSVCYNLTEKPREEAARRSAREAVDAVLGKFDNSPLDEPVEVGDAVVYPAFIGDSLTGAAVRVVSHEGFGGDITLMVGFGRDGMLRNFVVLSHAETPGLGAKAGEWFGSADRHVVGTHSDIALSVDGGEVDGITAATITSRAFVGAINHARGAFNSYIDKL